MTGVYWVFCLIVTFQSFLQGGCYEDLFLLIDTLSVLLLLGLL